VRAAARVRGPAWALVVLTIACGSDPAPVATGPVLDLPPRPADARGGAAFVRSLSGLDVESREERIVAEVARGNIPDWLRRLERVETTVEFDDGRSHDVAFWVVPDYLAVGSDDDFVFVPLSPGNARRVARIAGGSLPGPAMVDAVWRAASDRLIPIRLPPTEERGSVRYFVRHDRLIRAQRQQHDVPPGSFVAGHKVDVVRLNGPDGGADTLDLPDAPLALYGWHRSNGMPIQPVLPIEPEREPYYSMGVRVIDDEILVDGERVGLGDPVR
jgi:hypothetical protein